MLKRLDVFILNRPLFAHGIRPDCIDHLIDEEKRAPSGCGFVYFPLIPTRPLTTWQDKRLATYSDSPPLSNAAAQDVS